MIYVISKSTFGSYNVRDIQCNANWDCCPYSDYALIPDSLVDGILDTHGYCDITLNGSDTEVVSFVARAIPPAPKECRAVIGSATYPKAVSGEVITAYDSIAAPLPGLTLYGKTTQDGTPTPETPVDLVTAGAGGSVKVNVEGKNLYSDGDLFSIYVYRNITLEKPLPPGTYTLSAVVVSNDTDGTSSLVSFIGGASNGNNVNVLLKRNNRASVKVTLTAEVSTIRFCAGNSASNSSGDTAEYTDIQIERGSVATQFEPYKPIQTFTASTPDGLPGIPVTSNGNYTDENGQMWVADEIDFASGVKVKRIGVIESYDGEEISGSFMSTTGGLTAGAKVLYVLHTPVETPLSEEELAQYAALHTNKPNTTVYNDAGAYMDVEYFATNAAVPIEAGAANEGKFLRVVNGAAAWVTVNSAEGGSF